MTAYIRELGVMWVCSAGSKNGLANQSILSIQSGHLPKKNYKKVPFSNMDQLDHFH